MSFYDILGVNENASQDEIKKAYRKLSLKHHPDKGGDQTKFSEINEAYQTLGDKQKRSQYDMTKNGIPQGMPQGIPEEVFNMFFRAAGSSGGMPGMTQMNMNGIPFSFSHSSSGPNIRIFKNGVPVNVEQAMKKPNPIIDTIHISLEEAYNGHKYPYEVERFIQDGNIKQMEKETIYVDIPKGIDNNEIVVVREKGNQLSDTNKGDIKLFVKIKNNTQFERKGLDLILNKTITLKEALCGFEFSIEYFNNRNFKITNYETIIKPNFSKVIPKLGMERDGHHGQFHIIFKIEFPDNLDKETKESISKLL